MYRNKFVVTDEMLHDTPSRKDGCPVELEADLRTAGCDQIQIASQMLKIPQVTTSTAQVLFQRFFCVRSFLKFSLLNVAMACLYLASEAWESERLTVEVVNAFHLLRKKIKTASKCAQVEENPDALTFAELERIIHDNEFYILTDLCFRVDVDLPHQLLSDYLTKLNLNQHKGMTGLTWSYLNDSVRTNVADRFTPATLACASIRLAAHLLKVPLSKTPPWWTEFGANLVEMQAANVEMMNLRERPRHCLKDLQKRLSEVKEKNRRLSESEASTTAGMFEITKRSHFPYFSIFPAVRKETCHTVMSSGFAMPSIQNKRTLPPLDNRTPTKAFTVTTLSSTCSLPTARPFSIICRRFPNLNTRNSVGHDRTDITCHNAATEAKNLVNAAPRKCSVILGRRPTRSGSEVVPPAKRCKKDDQMWEKTTVDMGSTLPHMEIQDKKRCCKIALTRLHPRLLPVTTVEPGFDLACSSILGKRKIHQTTHLSIVPQPQTKKSKTATSISLVLDQQTC